MNMYESKCVDLVWDETYQAIVFKWKGYGNMTDIQAAFNKSIELVELKKAVNLVGEAQKQPTFVKELQDWVDQVWFSKIISTTIKKIAMVMPENFVSKSAVNKILNNAGTTIELGTFSTPEEAYAWLGKA